MSEGAVRIDLPSGGWWELASRPAWRRMRPLIDYGSTGALASRALIQLTRRWSFPEPVSERAVLSRDREDVAAALETLNRELLQPLREAGSRESAEALFTGMVAGSVPPGFVDVCLMTATGWTWRELSETPADVVIRTALLIAVRDARERGDDIDIWEEEDVVRSP